MSSIKPKRHKAPIFIRRVRGQSMVPAYKSGDLVIGMRGQRRPKVGQVVVIKHSGREKLKRVKQVQPGQVFVMGDNASESTDSREFGWVEQSNIIGRIIVKLPKLRH